MPAAMSARGESWGAVITLRVCVHRLDVGAIMQQVRPSTGLSLGGRGVGTACD